LFALPTLEFKFLAFPLLLVDFLRSSTRLFLYFLPFIDLSLQLVGQSLSIRKAFIICNLQLFAASGKSEQSALNFFDFPGFLSQFSLIILFLEAHAFAKQLDLVECTIAFYFFLKNDSLALIDGALELAYDQRLIVYLLG
jgi:hypothetical protein